MARIEGQVSIRCGIRARGMSVEERKWSRGCAALQSLWRFEPCTYVQRLSGNIILSYLIERNTACIPYGMLCFDVWAKGGSLMIRDHRVRAHGKTHYAGREPG